MSYVLVVDDEPYICIMVTEFLELDGLKAVTAGNGREALAIVQREAPQMILCDISMPGMNGFEFLESVRGDPRLEAVPFIFLTGHGDRATMRRGMELGADDFLTKPFSQAELMATVRTRLDRQRKLAAMRQADDNLPGMVHVLPHELNTPLQKILGFSDILREDHTELTGAEIGELAETIHRSALRLHHVAENFLAFAQVQLARQDPQRLEHLQLEVVRTPADIITDAAQIVAIEAGRRNDLVGEVTDAPVYITEANLRKIVEELVDNACKFSDEGSDVLVTGDLDDDWYLLEVRDGGRGMEPAEIERIGAFAQFNRQLYEQQGLGLGLALTVRLAELHGGRVEIASAPGEGTRVSVFLRRAPD